jgi:prepilin peptidase CpaA
MMPVELSTMVAIGVAAVACVTDIRTRRIPNLLTFGAAGLACVLHGFTGGLTGLGWSALGWLVGVVLFLPFFLLQGMGAGDVKLLAALGAFIGPKEVAFVAMYTSIAGGALGLGVALARGYLKTALVNLWLIVTHVSVMGLKPVPGMTLAERRGPRLAYAVPIFVGLMVTIWLHA